MGMRVAAGIWSCAWSSELSEVVFAVRWDGDELSAASRFPTAGMADAVLHRAEGVAGGASNNFSAFQSLPAL